MNGGEIYEHITDRDYIEQDNLIIILPKNVKINKSIENQIIQSAQRLF